MEEYLRKRRKQETASKITGVVLTAGLHVMACLCLSFTGLKYIYPPPPESTFVIDFDEPQPEPRKPDYRHSQPKAEDVDLKKEIKLVQKSESPNKTLAKKNVTPATKPDPVGDVETPAPKQEPKLDPRAAFPGMAKKDTTATAPHSAKEASATFKAGQPNGNTDNGRTDGTPNAHLKGRNTIGSLPKPVYAVQEEGRVVVKIVVDQYGNVKEATPGAAGTTVSDKTLWAAARKAAMGAHFNQSADAPALQEGTITYIFKLK